jgi:hypothetical protein
VTTKPAMQKIFKGGRNTKMREIINEEKINFINKE